jgi:hypothetical protein
MERRARGLVGHTVFFESNRLTLCACPPAVVMGVCFSIQNGNAGLRGEGYDRESWFGAERD